jgi:hypothetical protein
MKRLIKIGLVGIACFLTFGAGAYAATAIPKIFVNGNEVKTNTQPKIIDGSVYVPIRAISDGFGNAISWDNETKTVYVNSDPNAKTEPDRVSWVATKNLIAKFITAYDERRHDDAMEVVSKDFTTDIYLEFPTGGYTEMASIIDYKIIAYDGKNKFAVQIVRRLQAEERNIKVENWEFEITDRIQSIKVVPNSTKYLDQYTVVPNATFGVGY